MKSYNEFDRKANPIGLTARQRRVLVFLEAHDSEVPSSAAIEEACQLTIRMGEAKNIIGALRAKGVVDILDGGEAIRLPSGKVLKYVKHPTSIKFAEGELERRIERDQARLRAERERWLDIEAEKYGRPRGRLISM
jgi:hypothetical protein